MKKITILALHLGYGGIEKCISNLANLLCNDYKIEIISTYKLFDKPAFEINKKVKVKYLLTDLKPNKKEIQESLKKLKFTSLIKELIKAKKILKLKKELMINYIKNCHSDIIISTRDIHNLWLSKYGNSSCLKIGWEHNYHNNDKSYINKIVKSACNLDYFVLVSKDLEEFYRKKLENTKCKTINIPNMLDYYPNNVSSLKEESIISIGRLSKEKGFLDLIDVFKLVHELYPSWHLDIIGDGPEKKKIENKIHEYKLNDVITLHGFQTKEYINKMLEKSSVYVMCSLTEAFPIVLLEAFSFGIPAVSFTSANGACEIITDNWDGYLIKDRDKKHMAKRICELINNYNRRFIMGQNASKKSLNYQANEIKEKWIKIMEKGR